MANVTLEPVLDYIDRLARKRTNRDANDADLLNRFVARQDEYAFVGLLERYARLVWNVCRRVHGNVHDAEDSFQATFFVFARQAGKIRSSGALASWLYRLAYRTAMHAKKNTYQRRRREEKVAVPAGQSVAATGGLHELQAVLAEEVNRLAEKHRAPFVLCCLEGKSKSEAAAELGWKQGTVSSRLAHARKLLQDRLTRRGITLSAVLTAEAVSVGTASAAIPATLLTSTARAALPFALGQITGIGGCASAVRLADGVLKTMVWQKLKVVGALILATILLGTGTTVLSYGALGAKPTTLKPEINQSRDSQKPGMAEKKQPRLDLYGDPLPDGTAARLGTLRWRHDHSHRGGLFAHFSPDGKMVVTCHRFIRLWNVADGKLLREIGGDRSEAWEPIFSPDGKWLAANLNGQLVLIDVATGTTRQVLFTKEEAARYNVERVAFSPEGKPLAVGTSDNDIYLFDFPDGRRLRKVQNAITNRIATALTAESKTLIALSRDGKIGHWDTQTGALIRVAGLDLRPGQGENVYTIRFSPDGTTVAVRAGIAEPVVVFDTATGKERFRIKGQSEAHSPFAYSPDGKTLLTRLRAEGGTISLWDTKSGERKRRLNIPAASGCYFEISPDGKTLLATDRGPTVRLWDMDTGKRLTPCEGHENAVFQVVVTPNSKTLISGSCDGHILAWDLASGRVKRELRRAPEELSGLTLRPRTDEVVSWSRQGVIRLHNWRTGQESRRIDINDLFDKKEPSNKGSCRFLFGLECSPDGSQAVIFVGQIPGAPPTAAQQCLPDELVVYDLNSGRVVSRRKFIRYGTLSTDRKSLAYVLGSPSLTMILEDTLSGRELLRIPQPDSRFEGYAWAPDAQTLVTETYRQEIGQTFDPHAFHFWERATGKECLAIPLGHAGAQCLTYRRQFSADGRLLAAIRGDNMLQVWDAATGEELWHCQTRAMSPFHRVLLFPTASRSLRGMMIARFWFGSCLLTYGSGSIRSGPPVPRSLKNGGPRLPAPTLTKRMRRFGTSWMRPMTRFELLLRASNRLNRSPRNPCNGRSRTSTATNSPFVRPPKSNSLLGKSEPSRPFAMPSKINRLSRNAGESKYSWPPPPQS